MPTPDTKHSIVITKEFAYRGTTRRWTNRYHFEGDLPSSGAAWAAFADLIVAAEKLVYPSTTQIVQADGYDAGSATSTNPHGDAVFTKVYTVAGTFSQDITDNPMPGNDCGLLRWNTLARTVKNHPVYLFSYIHSGWVSAASADSLATDWKAVLQTYGNAWVAGFNCDGTARERCGPRGAGATSATVDQYTRHRDFPN